jgi:integrase
MHRQNLQILPYSGPRNYKFYLAGLSINGKRVRAFYKTRAEAEAGLVKYKSRIRQEGQAGLALRDSDRHLTSRCLSLLEPYPGHSLLDATKFYVAHLEATAKSITLDALLARFLESKRRARLSARHLEDLQQRLGRFVRDFGATGVRTITAAQIGDWLHGLGVAPQTFNNYHANLHTFFGYALDHDYTSSNPVEKVQETKVVEGGIRVFDPDALAQLLEAADARLVVPMAIGAFAGLRTAEILRLHWSWIDLERGLIHVNADIAKRSKRRLVSITENLKAWLSPYARNSGRVYPVGFRSYHKEINKLCFRLSVGWVDNGLRHSYASYHLAKHEDAPALALQMGETDVRTIFDHYREVVTPQAAERYWAIYPAKEVAA